MCLETTKYGGRKNRTKSSNCSDSNEKSRSTTTPRKTSGASQPCPSCFIYCTMNRVSPSLLLPTSSSSSSFFFLSFFFLAMVGHGPIVHVQAHNAPMAARSAPGPAPTALRTLCAHLQHIPRHLHTPRLSLCFPSCFTYGTRWRNTPPDTHLGRPRALREGWLCREGVGLCAGVPRRAAPAAPAAAAARFCRLESQPGIFRVKNRFPGSAGIPNTFPRCSK